MPDSPLSWLIALAMLAGLPGAALVGVWYMAKRLMGRDEVQVPRGSDE